MKINRNTEHKKVKDSFDNIFKPISEILNSEALENIKGTEINRHVQGLVNQKQLTKRMFNGIYNYKK